MTALLYFLIAVLSAGLSSRAWMLDRYQPARLAFLALGWSITASYTGFALSLLPGLADFRALYMLGGILVPACALWTIDRVFARDEAPFSPFVGRILLASAISSPLLTAAQIFLFSAAGRASVVEWIAGLYTSAVFLLAVRRLWEVHQSTSSRVDRARLAYLITVSSGAMAFTGLEQLARAVAPPVDPGALSLASRGLVLQGALPPFSVLFAGVALYFFYSTLIMFRLLDLHELFSRLATLLTSALVLLLVDGVTFMWVDTFTDYPFHSTFQIFLASLMFLAAYEPLRDNISWVANRVFNKRGQQLALTLANLRAQLSTVISTDGLVETLLSGLHASGRIPVCSIYLWNEGLDAFVCIGSRGHESQPLKAIAAHPFAVGFERGSPWYSRHSVLRRSRNDPEWGDILALLDAMNADLTVPFISNNVVLGWFHVRDEEWSDGFSAEEIERLQEVAGIGSVVLSNIQDFKVIEEKNRLAALGEMAAGLAHEIRNPLAGVKGAAQFLQADSDKPDQLEMLRVIIDEANRLDSVVRQFLDYARPFAVNFTPEHPNAIVTKVLTLLRAQGIPDNVVLEEHLAGDLASLPLDPDGLGQVLLNLFQNALHAMPNGGTLGIHTRRRKRVRSWVCEIIVTDTGEGITDDDLEKLFVPFFTTKDDGTGLGLAISQRIIQAHDGEIEAQSSLGRGSTFVIRLPFPEILHTEEVGALDPIGSA